MASTVEPLHVRALFALTGRRIHPVNIGRTLAQDAVGVRNRIRLSLLNREQQPESTFALPAGVC